MNDAIEIGLPKMALLDNIIQNVTSPDAIARIINLVRYSIYQYLFGKKYFLLFIKMLWINVKVMIFTFINYKT